MNREWGMENNEELGIRNETFISLSTPYSLLPTPHSSLLIPNFIPLQWFADDDDTPGKTEEPTEHKLQRLREEGQVVKSQELVSALGLFLPAMLLLFLAPSMLRTCVEMIRFFFLRVTEIDPVKDTVVAVVFLRYLVRLIWPILVVALFSAVFSNIVQTGFLFTTKPITPDFTRVLPRIGQFFRRIFSVDGLYNFFKSIIKMAIIGGVSFILIYSEINKLVNMQKVDVWTGLSTVSSIAIKMLIIAALLLIILSIPDYMFQRWRFRERNKMTRYEIKEEIKTYEADPQIQNRIRSRFRDLLRQNITTTVPNADVVVTNPTHFAVAIQYDRNSAAGPMVVALGADEMAARIKKIAQEYEVPIVENKPLARALYNETNVGDIIPVAHWNAVGAVLSKVWYINEARRRRMSA